MEWLGDFPNRLPIGDALDLGWKVTLMGVAIVFLALVCLIILTIVYPKVFGWIIPKTRAVLDKWAARREARKLGRAEKKASKKLVVADGASNSVETTTPATTVETRAATDDKELIAVITAAIAASLGTSSNGIRIKSLKRSRSSTPAWGRDGRYEQFRF